MKVSGTKVSVLIKRAGIIMFFMVLSSVITIYLCGNINSNKEQVNADWEKLMQFGYDLEALLRDSKVHAISYVTHGDPKYYNLYKGDGFNKANRMRDMISMMPNILRAEPDEVDAAERAYGYGRRVFEITDEAFKDVEKGDFEKAKNLITGSEYISNEALFFNSMNEYYTILNTRIQGMLKSAQSTSSTYLIISFFSLIALAGFGFFLLRNIRKKIEPISIFTNSSNDISSTNLDAFIQNNKDDEFISLYKSLLSINMLIEELDFMSKRHMWGEIEYFIDEERFSGSLKVAVKSINSNMKDNVDMVFDLVNILTRIGEGNFQLDIPGYPGKKAVLSISVENLLMSLRDVNNAINNQVNSMITGRLSDRSDTGKFKGDWALLLEGLNSVVDAVVAPINETIEVLAEVSKSNFDVQMQGDYNGDLALIKNSLNSTINSINNYIGEIHMLASVIMNADIGIVIKNIDGTVRNWNKGATKILGYSEAEMVGNMVKVPDSAEDQLLAEDEINRLARGEQIQYNDRRRLHKDGRIIHISGSFNLFYNAEGEVAGTFSIFDDITDQLAMENELKKTQENLVSILRIIPAPICAINLENADILECNDAFVAMCGLTGSSDGVGSKVSRFFSLSQNPDDVFREDMVLLESMKNNESSHFFVIKTDGAKIETEVFSEHFVFNDQEALAIYCVDLTEQRKHEQALLEAAAAAHDANKTKSQFLANMSHEIRTPMNGIIGLTELALDDKKISAKTLDYLLKIRSSADGLLHIINDILDLSKIEAGELVLEKIPFDLHTVFNECEIISTPKAEEKGLHIYFYNEPTIQRKLLGDPTKLRQALLNFLSNAIKFTRKGVVSLMSKSEPVPGDDNKVKLTFEIKDSGIGMTKEQVAKIFEPFKQADDSTTRKYGGTGLGLAITKNIIELMGGNVRVDSIPSVGSKFSFEIVFDLSDEESGPFGMQEGIPVEIEKPTFEGHVLVCEDNKTNQQVAQEHLEKIGFFVTIADNGKTGVELVKEQINKGKPFDIVFMDIHMPVMDGLEATTILIGMNIKAPIIAMTANAMSQDREKCIAAGMTDYISKPFKTQDLWSCLMKYMEPLAKPSADEPNLSGKESDSSGSIGILSDWDTDDIEEIIDMELGLERSAGSEKLYKKLLTEFLEEQPESPKLLQKAIDAADFVTARRLAHTAKSVAATLGAVKLSEVLNRLELAFATEQPVLDDDMIEAYKQELDKVLKYLSTLDLSQEKKADGGNLTFDKAKALDLISELRPLLESGMSESQDYLDKITETLAPAEAFLEGASGIAGKCETLISQIDDYDFELSVETLDEIKEIIEGLG